MYRRIRSAAAVGGPPRLLRAFVSRWVLHALLFCLALTAPGVVSAESICAEVKIEIKQTVALERQAFDAVLRVRNGLSLPVTDLRVELKFMDADGQDVPATTSTVPDGTSRFFYRADGQTDMTGDPASTNGATVAGGKTGEARWLIVPTAIAGGELPIGRVYRIGASIRYKLDNGAGTVEERTAEVAPDTIVVKPQPKVRLDYFLPYDVYGDDTQTEGITEPMVPFTLGVRVWNYGYGTARSLKIETAQPTITENDQGFPVEFAILDGYLDDAPAQPTLTIGFGDVAPSTARMGRWNMTATYSGQFVEFDATLRHADEFGGALTALIDANEVWTHRLLRDVVTDLPGRDRIKDYLARDADAVRLYESDGVLTHTGASRTDGSSQVTELVPTATIGSATATLRVNPAQNQLVFVRYEVTQSIAQNEHVTAVRSDGKALPAENAWFSKERDTSGDVWYYYLNVFDYHEPSLGSGQVVYTLNYGESAPQPASLRGAVYDDADGDGVRDTGEPALFDAQVTLSGLANGQAVEREARTDADGEYAFANLQPGTYQLAVADVPGYRNGVPTVGSAGGLLGQSGISHIALAPGADATGYAFGKIALRPDADSGDLDVAQLTSSTGTPAIGQAFTVVATLGNAGPDAVPAIVRLSLPAHVTLQSASASVGTYDANTATWDPGTLNVGATPALTLTLKTDTVGPFSIGALVGVEGALAIDPALGNNLRTLSLDARDPNPFTLAAQVVRETRLLALAGCPSTQAGNGCDDTTRAAALSGFFTEAGVRHRVVENEDDFIAEMRSGEWNTYWISSGAAQKLGAPSALEISQALVRQEWLILDNPDADDPGNPGAVELQTLIPVLTSTEIPDEPGDVVLFDSLFLPDGTLATSGRRYEFLTRGIADVERLAVFAGEDGGVVGPNDDRITAIQRVNRTILTGFDLFDALSQNATLRPVLIAKLLDATRPELPDTYVVGDYVAVAATATNPGAPLNAWLHFSMPAGATVAYAQPTPYDGSNGAAWTRTIATGAEFTPSVGLRATTPAGDRVVQVEARSGSAGGTPLAASVDVPFTVTHWGSVMLSLRNAFEAADLPSQVQHLDDAQRAWEGSRYNDAILGVIHISRSLDSTWRSQGDHASELAIGVGRLLRGLQREWYVNLMTCSPTLSAPAATTQDLRLTDGEAPALIAGFGASGSTTAAWWLGYAPSLAPQYATAAFTLASGTEYQWQLQVGATGNAELRLGPVGGSTTSVLQYSAARPNGSQRPFGFGNNVELKIALVPEATSVEARIVSINGQSATMTPLATSPFSTSPLAAYLRYPAGATSLDVVGRVKTQLLPSGTAPPAPPIAEMFGVRTFSSNVCRRPGA